MRLPVLNEIAGRKVLILRGVGGREYLAQTLSSRGAFTDFGELYRRQVQHHDGPRVASELRGRGLSAVTVHSGESLAALGELGEAHLHELFTMPLVVPSDRVAAQARKRGFLNVHNAGGAGDEMMMAALEKIYSSGH